MVWGRVQVKPDAECQCRNRNLGIDKAACGWPPSPQQVYEQPPGWVVQTDETLPDWCTDWVCPGPWTPAAAPTVCWALPVALASQQEAHLLRSSWGCPSRGRGRPAPLIPVPERSQGCRVGTVVCLLWVRAGGPSWWGARKGSPGSPPALKPPESGPTRCSSGRGTSRRDPDADAPGNKLVPVA